MVKFLVNTTDLHHPSKMFSSKSALALRLGLVMVFILDLSSFCILQGIHRVSHIFIMHIKHYFPTQEIQFVGIKWQDGRRHIPMDVINKIAAMSPLTSKQETQVFLGIVGFWRMHIPN